MSNDLKAKARQLAMNAGLSYEEATSAAKDFLSSIDRYVEKQKASVEIKVHSLDKTAGEIVIRVHERSSRQPADILVDTLERYNKDPDKWAISGKIGNTVGGYTSYLAKPKKQPTKKKRSRSSSSSSRATKKQSLEERFDQLPEEKKAEVLKKLLQQQDEEEMDL
jgi:gas vesicle protein